MQGLRLHILILLIVFIFGIDPKDSYQNLLHATKLLQTPNPAFIPFTNSLQSLDKNSTCLQRISSMLNNFISDPSMLTFFTASASAERMDFLRISIADRTSLALSLIFLRSGLLITSGYKPTSQRFLRISNIWLSV